MVALVSLDQIICVYLGGCLMTAVIIFRHQRFYRRVFLWPIFWLVIIQALLFGTRRERHE